MQQRIFADWFDVKRLTFRILKFAVKAILKSDDIALSALRGHHGLGENKRPFCQYKPASGEIDSGKLRLAD